MPRKRTYKYKMKQDGECWLIETENNWGQRRDYAVFRGTYQQLESYMSQLMSDPESDLPPDVTLIAGKLPFMVVDSGPLPTTNQLRRDKGLPEMKGYEGGPAMPHES